jgi:hypothetical protein
MTLPTTPRGLLDVDEFLIPGAILDHTIEVLARAGQHHHEAFVVWGGSFVGDAKTFRFTSAIVPAQRAHSTPDGLLVTVDGAALFEVNKTLYTRRETLGGQVHSHPTEAFHSETDDHFPLVTLLGSLSVVVPDFAIKGLNGVQEWAWYRLVGIGAWKPVDQQTKIRIGQ